MLPLRRETYCSVFDVCVEPGRILNKIKAEPPHLFVNPFVNLQDVPLPPNLFYRRLCLSPPTCPVPSFLTGYVPHTLPFTGITVWENLGCLLCLRTIAIQAQQHLNNGRSASTTVSRVVDQDAGLRNESRAGREALRGVGSGRRMDWCS